MDDLKKKEKAVMESSDDFGSDNEPKTNEFINDDDNADWNYVYENYEAPDDDNEFMENKLSSGSVRKKA